MMRDKTFNSFAMLRRCPNCDADIASDEYQGVRWFPQREHLFWFPICDGCMNQSVVDMARVAERVTAFIKMGVHRDNLRLENEKAETARS